jgi:hypothetical protein
MAKRIQKKEYEKLDDLTISKVVELFATEKPITKKAACEILNISYNTARLAKIIEDYKERIAYTAKRKEQNKGTPLDAYDIRYLVINYLKGDAISSIAEGLYRSYSMIQKALKDNNIPLRNISGDYFHPLPIPDENIQEEFKIEDLVWSARYNCVAEIDRLAQTHNTHGNVYSIWVYGKYNEYAYQPWYELGILPIVEKLKITKDDIKLTDKLNLNYV